MPLETTGPHSPVASVDGKTPGDKPEASVEKVRFNAETELPSPVSFSQGLTIVGCTLLIKHVWDLSHVASGVLIVSAACWVENLDRALYSIISCVTPLLMALHRAPPRSSPRAFWVVEVPHLEIRAVLAALQPPDVPRDLRVQALQPLLDCGGPSQSGLILMKQSLPPHATSTSW
jgi:hypothetical protein